MAIDAPAMTDMGPSPDKGKGTTPVLGADEDLEHAIKVIVDKLELEDRPAREVLLRDLRKLELFWINIQHVFWSDLARDWRPLEQLQDEDPDEEYDPAMLSKIINIFRAHGESMIAAMSASVPSVWFFPEDADNPDDIARAKAETKISEKVQYDNDANILFIRIFYLMFTQGLVGLYNYHHASDEYGIVRRPVYGLESKIMTHTTCPQCGEMMSEPQELPSSPVSPSLSGPTAPTDGLSQETEGLTLPTPKPENVPEFPALSAPIPETPFTGVPPQTPPEFGASQSPGSPPLAMEGPPPQPGQAPPSPMGMVSGPEQCPNCGAPVTPETQTYEAQIPFIKEFEVMDKGIEKVEAYGPLHMKVSAWATKQEDCPYVILEGELHYSTLRALYPERSEEIQPTPSIYPYDRYVRTDLTVHTEGTVGLTTHRRIWLRPSTYYILEKTDPQLQRLLTDFPDGLYAVQINDKLFECEPEKLDEHWTLAQTPISQFIHTMPLGKPLVPMQEMRNEAINLVFQTIQFGISEIFVDPQVLNFEEYKKTRAAPGQITAARARSGMGLDASFHETKPATLSQEIDPFIQRLDVDAQFVSADFPSLFGGEAQGSKTLGEYQQSRAQAMQRLSTPWKVANVMWARCMQKAVKEYAENILEDEKFVKKNGKDSFINVWIKQAELSGTVGRVEAEANEGFPVSWAQKRGLFLELLGQVRNIPQIGSVIFHPNNVDYSARILGFQDMYIPGSDDRESQLREIVELLASQPIPGQPDPMNPMMPPQPQPSVSVNQMLDDHQMHAEVCKAWLISPEGHDAQQTNPQGYQNVLLHYQAHTMIIQGQMAGAMPPPNPVPGQPSPGPGPGGPTPGPPVPPKPPAGEPPAVKAPEGK